MPSLLKLFWMLQGRVFIDRDPKHFRIILNYLRDGTCALPADEAGILELLQEVEFYQVKLLQLKCCPKVENI